MPTPAAGYDSKHLHIVLTNPCENNKTLIVPVTSVKDNQDYDSTCILNAGDHEFIKHKSWVYYKLSRIVDVQIMKDEIKKRNWIDKGLLKEDVFSRVIAGMKQTKKPGIDIDDYFEEQQKKN